MSLDDFIRQLNDALGVGGNHWPHIKWEVLIGSAVGLVVGCAIVAGTFAVLAWLIKRSLDLIAGVTARMRKERKGLG
jgi:hypothetical protein